MLWTDLVGIGTLAAASDLWPIPLAMLFAFFGLTFGAAASGAATTALGRDDPAEAARAGSWRFARFAGLQPAGATRRRRMPDAHPPISPAGHRSRHRARLFVRRCA
jgi:hypothetical protein